MGIYILSILLFIKFDLAGDLTDAKTVDRLGSKQYIEEWATYRDIIQTSGILNDTVWLDIRGNHG